MRFFLSSTYNKDLCMLTPRQAHLLDMGILLAIVELEKEGSDTVLVHKTVLRFSAMTPMFPLACEYARCNWQQDSTLCSGKLCLKHEIFSKLTPTALV